MSLRKITLELSTIRRGTFMKSALKKSVVSTSGNDSNLLIVFYVQIMPDDFVMQLHRF
ncbi:fimbriae usher protein StfC [Shigella sonnei]|nr:fimbriae usher protein StfC [Shigella sonnei]